MIGHKPNYYWIVCWVAVTPMMIAVYSVITADNFTPAKRDESFWTMFTEP